MFERLELEASKMKYSLTEGPIARSIVTFAAPIIIGNLFQQMYSMVDAIIVGRLLGKTALAAVSVCVNPNYLMMDVIIGLSVGAGIVIANAYGAQDEDRLFKAVHTTVALSVVVGVFVTVVAWFAAKPLLIWLNTPGDVIDEAMIYFRYFYIGALGMSLYNCGTGILRSIGDSIRPLFYLVIASVLNVILDYVFVAWLHLGIGSVAVATSLAQSVSAVLCLVRLARCDASYRLLPGKIRIYTGLVSPIIRYSIPAGVQNGMIAISNVLIGASINMFGADVIAGSGIWFRVQGFALMPVNAMMLALSTYVAQNDGAEKYSRIWKGTRVGIIICLIIGLVSTAILIPFAGPLAAIFNDDPLVIENAIINAKIMGPLLVLLAFTHSIGGTLQGAGWVKQSMWTYILCWCVVRVGICTIAVRMYPVIELVYLAYPITWVMSAVTFLYFYIKLMKEYMAKEKAKASTAPAL